MKKHSRSARLPAKQTEADHGSQPLTLDRQLCFPIYAASHLLQRAYRPLLEPLGLTYPQYLVMMVLWEADGISVSDLTERLLLDSGTLSPLVKRLEVHRLVVKRVHSEDGRRVRVFLTPKGKALKEEAIKVPQMLLCHVLEQTDPDFTGELEGLRDRLKALVSALSQSPMPAETVSD